MVVSLLMGSVLGFLSGLGTGGGSLLILWLTLCRGWDSQSARLANLMFFIPAALVACFFRCRQGSLSFRKVLPAMIAGCITSFLLSFVSQSMDPGWLKKLFGLLLLLTGFRELFYREQKRK